MLFANPPLAELVAELRWVPGATGSVNRQIGTTIQLPIGFGEESLEKFRRSIAQKGFAASERLVPVGFPLIPFTVAQRFRKPSTDEKENYLYQVGLGVFSANALPPYRNWDSFRPIVREGVETLLATRHSTDGGNVTVLLRYLDVFTEEFTEGRTSLAFLNDILGITLLVPATLTEQASNLPEVRAGLQLSLNLKDGLSMNIGVHDGAVGTKAGIVMSTEAFTIQQVNPQLDSIMENFERAHDYIRVTFLRLTTKIHDKMKLTEG